MSLIDAISRINIFTPPSLPELRYLSAAARKVRERWPDVTAPKNEREREGLAQKLRMKIERDDWSNTRLSFVTAAAAAVFDPERRDRSDFHETRAFLYAETRSSTSPTLLSGILRAHLESYTPGAAHTVALVKALAAAVPQMSPATRRLLEAVPELLNPDDGPNRLATRMVEMSDPFAELIGSGVRNPHGVGFMEMAHHALTDRIRSELGDRSRIDWFFAWLRPAGREARTTGAERAIEALFHPWLKATPIDELRSHLVETIIEMYGDPRIKTGGVWGGVGESEMAVIHRWLTREDMRFFTGVVDAAQKDAMWPPRRDFWLRLFDEKKIDAAWVAFSSNAMEYARAHMMRQDARNADSRFGYQRARPSTNTSLLIMKIGNKIMVDGCHSYRTHVFHKDDPMAPQLFLEGYDCEEIMRASDARMPRASKSHNSIEIWMRWVRDMINADVKRSTQLRPYTHVFRPRGGAPRSVVPSSRMAPRSILPAPTRRELPVQPRFDLRRQTESSSAPRTTLATRQVPSTDARGAQTSTGSRAPLLDFLIRSGPPAAAALLDQFAQMKDGKMNSTLSPKARAGLEWIRAGKGEVPMDLQRALTHLLSSMETFGQGPTGIIMRAGVSPVSVKPSLQAFPPLPINDDQCFELLRQHVDAMVTFGRSRPGFESDTDLSSALTKVRGRNTRLSLDERHKLRRLYEMMRSRPSGESS